MSELSKYYLMSLNTPLLELDILPETGSIIRVTKVLNKDSLPYGVDGSTVSVFEWSAGRRIPASRKHMRDLSLKYGMDFLIYNSLALSLSDSFWIKSINSDISWEDVNFFTNNFTDDVGEFLVQGDGKILSLMSPSNTTDGVYPKKWTIIDGFRALVKQGDRDGRKFDDVSEIIATDVLSILSRYKKIPYASYFRVDQMSCASWNFVKEGQNLITAYKYLLHMDSDPEYNTRDYCYRVLEQSIAKESIDLMLVLDYILFNRDRHFNNFGFIQDAKTGNLLGPAPIYDTGCSLFAAFGVGHKDDIINKDFKSRPFAPTHNSQIKYVNLSNFKQELEEISYEIENIISTRYEECNVDKKAVKSLCIVVQQRVNGLLNQSNKQMFDTPTFGASDNFR